MTNDFAARLARASQHVDVDWNTDEVARMQARLAHRLRRRQRHRRWRRGMLVVLLPLVLGVGVAGRLARSPAPVAGSVSWSEAPDSRVVRLGDGSLATLADGARIQQTVDTASDGVTVELAHGSARFDVVRHPARSPFRVVAGQVSIEVVGTIFTVERRGPAARVAVDKGRVRVAWGGGEILLGPGDTGVFPPALEPAEPALETTPAPAEVPPAPRPAQRPPHVRGADAAAPSWRALARDGEFERAYLLLARDGAASIHGDAGDLLLAADVARLSGHPAAAVPSLREVLERHGADPRAPLAAFTLGRVLLEELGDPRRAAEAFASTQRLDPHGPLAENALAREVEAWFRAGEGRRARERGETYVRRYPTGDKMRLVRRYAALE